MPKQRSSKAQTIAKQSLLGRFYVLHEYLAYEMPNDLFGKPLSNWNYALVGKLTKQMERDFNKQNDGWDEELVEPLSQIDEWLDTIYPNQTQ